MLPGAWGLGFMAHTASPPNVSGHVHVVITGYPRHQVLHRFRAGAVHIQGVWADMCGIRCQDRHVWNQVKKRRDVRRELGRFYSALAEGIRVFTAVHWP